jgi:hypothetical protein
MLMIDLILYLTGSLFDLAVSPHKILTQNRQTDLDENLINSWYNALLLFPKELYLSL